MNVQINTIFKAVTSKLAVLGFGLLLASGASAQHFYLGGSIGNAKMDLGSQAAADVSDILINDYGLSGTVSVTSDNQDDNDVGYKIFGGYSFNDYFAIEAFYADFGKVHEDVTATINVTDGTDTLVGTASLGARLDTTGYGFDFLASYPVSRQFSLFAKLGYIFYKVDANLTLGFSGTQNGVPATLNDATGVDDDGSDVSYGVGGDYYFNDNMAVRLDWQRYKVKAFDTDLDTDMVAASFIYRF